jgi:lipopolysaccharide/colanic/teichoic acid biosynthesis glycosyltransferase
MAFVVVHVGTLAIVLGLSKFHATVAQYDFTDSARFGWAIGFWAVLATLMYGLGVPDGPRTPRERLTAAFSVALLGGLAISVAQLVVGSAVLPRYVVFGTVMLLVPWVMACSRLSALGRIRQEDRDRVVVLSDLPLSLELRTELLHRAERPASVCGSIALGEVVGPRARPGALQEAVARHRGTVLVLGPDAQADERVIEQAARLHEHGLRIRTYSLFYEEWLGKIPVGELARVSLFFDIGEVHRATYGRFKRILDVVFAVLGMVALAVLAPVVVVVNRRWNRGPLVFSQDRIGRNGRVIRLHKFRTMAADGDAPAEWTSEEDPRVTPFGRLLRRTHLDELPQAINVLRGDLSIVGPRPEQPAYVRELTDKLPFYSLRHCVRPGLTGWAQVKYGYAGDEADAREKLQYDFHYLRRQSVAFDLRIVVRTIRSVLGMDGR